jgi:hypothetical protein
MLFVFSCKIKRMIDCFANETVEPTGISRALVHNICAKNVQGPLVSAKNKRENQLQ